MPSGSIVSMGDHCRGGVTSSGRPVSITLGTGSETTNGNYFTDLNQNGGSYAFNTGIHLWAIQSTTVMGMVLATLMTTVRGQPMPIRH